MKNRKNIVIAAFVALSLAFTGCAKEEKKLKKEEKTYQGIIEATDVDINSKVPGKIGSVNTTEGQEVKEGDLIAVIDSKELTAKKEQAIAVVAAAKGQFDAAQSQVNAANSVLQKAQNGARTQEIAQAQAYYDLMLKTYQRVNELYEKDAIPVQKRDEVKAQLDIAQQKLEMAKEGARVEDISGAQAMVASAMNMVEAARGKYDQAKGALDEVNAYISELSLKSPLSGTVTLLNVDKGELVSTGMSIATISDLNNIWVEVNMDETELEKITEGQKVSVKVPAFKKIKFEGKIVNINKKPDFAVKKASNDNGEYDVVSYGVKIKIENKDSKLRPGMTAIVDFKK